MTFIDKEYRKKIVKAVTSQLINMLSNDILEENGLETFEGWCAEGEVYELNGMTEQEVTDAMELTKIVSDKLEDILFYNLNIDEMA